MDFRDWDTAMRMAFRDINKNHYKNTNMRKGVFLAAEGSVPDCYCNEKCKNHSPNCVLDEVMEGYDLYHEYKEIYPN